MNQTQSQSAKRKLSGSKFQDRRQGSKIIKKYGNRKLYDTEQSSYVVLRDIEKMIRNREDIKVIHNETAEDITVSTLTQIIFSLEKKSKLSPPINILKSIIREGDGSFSAFLAKLGLFAKTPEGGSKKDRSLAKGLAGKKSLAEEPQSLEQKIASLINREGLSSEDSVPELPASQLS